MTTYRLDGNQMKFIGLVDVPGEGIFAALQDDVKGTMLFDRQGLAWCVTNKRKKGQDSQTEEMALARIEAYFASNTP